MKNSTITYIIIAVLLICNVILISTIRKNKFEAMSSMEVLYPYTQKYTMLKSNIINNIEYGSTSIGNSEIIDQNQETKNIKNLLESDERIIILRFSERYCNSCVKYFVELFTNEAINKNCRIIYFAGYANYGHMQTAMKDLGIVQKEIYNIPFVDSKIDKEGFPYLMVVNSNLEIEYCYFPNKGYPEADIENINIIIDGFAKKTKNK